MSNEVYDENDIDDRDTIKDGKAKKENSNVSKSVAFFILLGVCGYLVYLTLSTSTDKKKSVEPPKKGIIKQTEFFSPADPKPPVLLETAEQDKTLLPTIELPTPQKTNTQNFDNSLLEAAQRAPVLAYSNQNQAQTNGETNNETSLHSFENKPDEAAQRFNHLLEPTVSKGVRASVLGNRNYIIAMGASIPCILETAISSDQQGFVSCIVSRDILSDNGRVVLLDKGTQIVGEYRSELKKGQNRLFVLWNRAKTPNGVIITLASPATDALGRSGIDGEVDNHWFERIGSAFLISFVKDITRYAGEHYFPKDQNTKSSNTVSTGQDIANIFAENYANIPPTLTKNQGEIVNVFVARDLDFSSVYKLKVTENKKRILNRALLGNFYKNPVTFK
ncbi:type IV secretion system protein VirB10 [Bartonella sp. F02]|uniref:type IV secretion system protein VirB10 n=1 Tax=Bartonella sp. F02 TaxID=2967262 RepID=UPI0022A9BE3F|nr:type IV secretion system protein VirB10 [Bartonella sp. F02]MCZ2328940.1 type IV secretion system protein VirB10 [Bartonella sp. F02]